MEALSAIVIAVFVLAALRRLRDVLREGRRDERQA